MVKKKELEKKLMKPSVALATFKTKHIVYIDSSCVPYVMLHSYDQCEVKTSKKRPLWMVWENSDPLADLWYKHYTILFKNGDGKPLCSSLVFLCNFIALVALGMN